MITVIYLGYRGEHFKVFFLEKQTLFKSVQSISFVRMLNFHRFPPYSGIASRGCLVVNFSP